MSLPFYPTPTVSLHTASHGPHTPAPLPPLVLLHGFLGTGGNLHSLARRFSERRTVLVPDARNHGRSPHTDAFGYGEMATDLLALLDAHGVATADLLGHSMGGKTAMTLALAHPARVRRLVAVDIGPGRSPASHTDVLGALAAVDLEAALSRSEVEAALAVRLPDAGVRGWLLKNLLRTPGGFRWALNVPVLAAHADAVAEGIAADGRFDGPALFVRGGRSRYLTDDEWPGVRARFPAAELVTIPGAGHWVHADAPDALFEAAAAFFDR